MCIAKRDLWLKSFRRVPAQVINDSTRQKRLERARANVFRHAFQPVVGILNMHCKLNPVMS